MIWNIYLRQAKFFIPSIAKTEAGYFLEIEPVAVMDSVPEGSCASWRTEDESGQPKALAVALSFCRLLGLGCPKQAFAKIATLFFVVYIGGNNQFEH